MRQNPCEYWDLTLQRFRNISVCSADYEYFFFVPNDIFEINGPSITLFD